MNFSLEIGPHTNLETLPALKDVYITFLPGGDFNETASKANELAKKGFNPIPHFPASSIKNDPQLTSLGAPFWAPFKNRSKIDVVFRLIFTRENNIN